MYIFILENYLQFTPRKKMFDVANNVQLRFKIILRHIIPMHVVCVYYNKEEIDVNLGLSDKLWCILKIATPHALSTCRSLYITAYNIPRD